MSVSPLERLVTGAVILLATVGWFAPGRVTIHLVGDSTMADKPLVDNPERGWGQLFPMYFDGSVDFVNHARNGRSTKSFIDEGRWATVVSALKEGDYVFIQFGHNDGKKEDSTRYAAPRPTYKENLRRFVTETRARKAYPILLTPVSRRKFDSTGALVDTHGEYPAVVKEISVEERVPLVDLQAKSANLLTSLGDEPSKRLFLWVEPGRFAALAAGKRDNTHFVAAGAFAVAGLVAEGLRESASPLARALRPRDKVNGEAVGATVALDEYYNNEWRTASDSTRHRFHYVWDDTTNSGFSQLGSAFAAAGAVIETVPAPPTTDRLSLADVYIIVDPDTPLETSLPHFITPAEATVIEAWVRQGGVLVLLANDKGNSEFDHLNGLSERFGIRFNQDSYHRVIGKNYEDGAVDHFPWHPLFAGVRKIFLKEVSSLSLTAPAEALLTEQDIVLMAQARIGKGLVFAVGDPWLYNEYVDHRRLPIEFENDVAMRNLVRWLCAHGRHGGSSGN